MKTSDITIEDIQRSVLAVPPLCRNGDLSLNKPGNAALVRYLEAGGVSTLMYGGNANFYNVGAGELPEILDMLEDIAADESWVIPSCGPDYGKLMDQAPILKSHAFPTAMILPLVFPKSPKGVEDGIRRFADAYGKAVITYIKIDDYLEPDQLARLIEDKVVCAIKYARVLPDPAIDPYLEELCKVVDTDRIISGIGERPVITHWNRFGLRAFTSGSVCVAPRASTELLTALQNGNVEAAESIRKIFIPLEDMRDALSPLCILHRAVELAGIAETGPLAPMLSDVVEGESIEQLRRVSSDLAAHNDTRFIAA